MPAMEKARPEPTLRRHTAICVMVRDWLGIPLGSAHKFQLYMNLLTLNVNNTAKRVSQAPEQWREGDSQVSVRSSWPTKVEGRERHNSTHLWPRPGSHADITQGSAAQASRGAITHPSSAPNKNTSSIELERDGANDERANEQEKASDDNGRLNLLSVRHVVHIRFEELIWLRFS